MSALPKMAGFYGWWYPSRWLGWGAWPRFSEFGPLAGHVRFAERTTRKLARTLFHQMLKLGPKLEKRQALLFRAVDIGADIFAMAAALSRAQALRRAGAAEAPKAVELADIFCRGIRRRIAELFRGIGSNDDVAKYRTARQLLDGEFEWLEKGLTALEGARGRTGAQSRAFASRPRSSGTSRNPAAVKKALVGLAVLAALGAGVVYGFAAYKQRWFPYRLLRAATVRPAPRPSRIASRRRPADATRRAQREKIGELTQLPYLQGYNPATNERGVVLFDEARAFRGWNLALSAHAAQAQLLDMTGVVAASMGRRGARGLARSRKKQEPQWLRSVLAPRGASAGRRSARRVGVHRIARIDRRSGVVVGHPQRRAPRPRRGRGRHDLRPHSGDEGESRRQSPTTPSPKTSSLSSRPTGRAVRRISLLDAFEGSDYAAVLAPMQSEGDLFHANSIQILDGALASRAPAFAAGNLLVSLHALNVVVVLDPKTEKIVWALSGQWRAQHGPRILENGRMLLFDNFGGMRSDASRVLEVDPFTQQVVWRYGEREGEKIFSESNGTAQRLDNGNTLILESNFGRAIEVSPDGETVWEYLNPFRAGEKEELVATLTQVSRLIPAWPWSGRTVRRRRGRKAHDLRRDRIRRSSVALATGRRLGPYEILSPIGAGGMGEVYAARDTRLDRRVAIKVLSRGAGFGQRAPGAIRTRGQSGVGPQQSQHRHGLRRRPAGLHVLRRHGARRRPDAGRAAQRPGRCPRASSWISPVRSPRASRRRMRRASCIAT